MKYLSLKIFVDATIYEYVNSKDDYYLELFEICKNINQNVPSIYIEFYGEYWIMLNEHIVTTVWTKRMSFVACFNLYLFPMT